MREKTMPMRRCIGCMSSFPKNQVIRMVAFEGKPMIDLSGKKNGRGAYLCRSLDCLETAIKKRRLTYTLGISMTAEELAVFKDEYAKILDDAEVN